MNINIDEYFIENFFDWEKFVDGIQTLPIFDNTNTALSSGFPIVRCKFKAKELLLHNSYICSFTDFVENIECESILRDNYFHIFKNEHRLILPLDSFGFRGVFDRPRILGNINLEQELVGGFFSDKIRKKLAECNWFTNHLYCVNKSFTFIAVDYSNIFRLTHYVNNIYIIKILFERGVIVENDLYQQYSTLQNNVRKKAVKKIIKFFNDNRIFP